MFDIRRNVAFIAFLLLRFIIGFESSCFMNSEKERNGIRIDAYEI